ncbi:MAG TPA: ferritin family protein [Thermoanaerobaculia bacterium]|nr:ferritin family protein [Thermoanaerobaculia bacterium]
MSRIPRDQEHLKTGFTAEAASAARYRAYAERAEAEGLPNLAREWLDMAAQKDLLAMRLLETAGQVKGEGLDIAQAISTERYENEVLYPKMLREVSPDSGDAVLAVIASQKEQLRRLEALRDRFMAAQGDVALPAEVDAGTGTHKG